MKNRNGFFVVFGGLLTALILTRMIKINLNHKQLRNQALLIKLQHKLIKVQNLQRLVKI